MTDVEDLRNRVASIVSGPETASGSETTRLSPASGIPRSRFSPFDSEHMSRATALASRFMEIADTKGGEEGLAAAVQEMERTLGTEEISGLVQHAVRLFLVHHKEASEKLGKR